MSPGQTWVNNLPVWQENTEMRGYGIYTGIVNGLRNLIVKIDQQAGDQELRFYMCTTDDSAVHWVYDEKNDTTVAVPATGTNWAGRVISGSGIGSLVTDSGVERLADLDKSSITFKLIRS